MKKKVIIAVVALAAVFVLILIFTGKNGEYEFNTQEVTKGDIESVISTTGTINPVNTVEVGSQVSGNILALYADFNSVVKKGMLIAEIDPSTYQSRLNEANANLLKAKVTLKQAQSAFKRGQQLYKEEFISDSELEDLEFAVESAEATLAQQNASYATAKTNLENCKIYSPIDGVVVSRNVDTGQTVAASLQAPTLFQIAEDLAKMQIEVSVDEADIGRIKTDQKVKFDVDAYPERKFIGKVTQIRLQPEIVSNVVTYIVIVEVDNSDNALKPGMTANVSVIEKERSGVLKIPVSATRFYPTEELLDIYLAEPPEKTEKDDEKTPAAEEKSDTSDSQQGGKLSEAERRQRMQRFMAMSEEERARFRKKMEARAKARGEQIRTVWVLTAENKLRPYRLTLGISDGDSMEVVRGRIKEGDKVITSALKDGVPVQGDARSGISFRDMRRAGRMMGR